jgi:acyl-CoA synthetase (AMP-forming)/AMP-acid ligase II
MSIDAAEQAGEDGAMKLVKTVGTLAKTGLLRPIRPDRLLRIAGDAKKFGSSPATAFALSAHRHPKRTAIIDARGILTFGEVDRRTNNLARHLRGLGIEADGVMGILCRNHRGFVDALITAGKLGTDAVLLNTGFSGPQLGEVSRREGVTFLVADDAFASEVAESGLADEIPTFRTWTTPEGGWDAPSFDELAADGDGTGVDAPGAQSAVVILSSGTTGTPKGTKRSIDRDKAKAGMAANMAVIDRIPVRAGHTTLISAPLFHTWGLTNFLVCSLMSSPMVLRERFDPVDVVETLSRERVQAYVAVPAMLQRILEVPEDVRRKHPAPNLLVTALSGSALPGGLATRWMDAYGDNLYSLYGSTEVAAVAIAGPEDLRAAPDTAGPPVPAVDLKLLDDDGNEVKQGETGRIFVRSGMLFDGYTGGGSKEVIDGYMNTGDLGHLDDAGRLYVDGREDDMIVSGGENVYPQEVEEVIHSHDAVADAVVFGVPDAEFGQRLVAMVVAVEGVSPTEDEIKDWVRSNLARYKVPREVQFRDELPRNTTGKLLRRVLVDEAKDSD